MGLLYKNHHPDKTVSDSGRTILPYLPPHPCLAGGLECLQWLLRFSQQLASHSNGSPQPWSPKRKLLSWAKGGDGATLPGLCVGTQGWQSTPRYCFTFLHEIKRAAGKSATRGLRLLCKNKCPAPPSGPRGGPSTVAVGRGTLCVGRPTVCPTHLAQVRLPRALVSAARFSQKAKLLVTFSTRARIRERRRPRPASPECTPPPAAHPLHLGSMGREPPQAENACAGGHAHAAWRRVTDRTQAHGAGGLSKATNYRGKSRPEDGSFPFRLSPKSNTEQQGH